MQARLMICLGRRPAMEPRSRVILQKCPITLPSPTAIDRSAACEQSEPVPESMFARELFGLSRNSAKRLLQRIARGLLVSSRQHEVITQEPIEILRMKPSERIFIARSQSARKERGR